MKAIRRLIVLLVGVSIGAIAGSWSQTQAEGSPSGTDPWEGLPSLPAVDPGCSPSEALPELSQATSRLEGNIAQLTKLDTQLREVIGEPMPFGDEVGEAFTPEAAAETLAASELEDVELDCSEYPCLFFARVPEGDGCGRLDLFPPSIYSRGSCGNGTVTSAAIDPDMPPPDNRLQHRLRMFQRRRSPTR